MKKYISLVFILFFALSTLAQKFCYVDTQYVLDNLPEYTSAQGRLKQQTEDWKRELENKKQALGKLKTEFESEKILLTDEQIIEKQFEIDEEEKNIRELQDRRYGPTGDLILLRRTLIKPIQDRVYNAAKKVADKRGYSFVFDKGSNLIMIYTDPKFDISRDILNQLLPKSGNQNEMKKLKK